MYCERLPLIEPARVHSQHSRLHYSGLMEYVKDKRAVWESSFGYLRDTCDRYLKAFQYALPLVWPDKESGLQYRPIQCFGIFFLHRVLYILVPYLFGSLIKALEDGKRDVWVWILLNGLLVCRFVKDYVCKNLQSWLWLEVALRSQQVIALKFLDKIFDCPEDERWATGGLLSDFNKGGCLNKCLEQAIFVWTAVAFDLVTTAISVYLLLGMTYGFLCASISVCYICCIARNAHRSLPLSRGVVGSKRQKDVVAKPILGAILDIVLQNGIKREVNNFKVAQDSYHNQKLNTSIALIFQTTFPNIVFLVGSFIMSTFTLWQITNEHRTVQHLVLLLTFMKQLQETLDSLGASVQEFLNGVVDTERILRVLMEDSKRINTIGGMEIIKAANIEFESVKVGSKSLDLQCKEGGITTISNLLDHERQTLGYRLIRITDLQNGTIRIGGFDIQKYSTDLLRRKIGFLPRECKLLGKTIMQSLRYGLRDSESIEDQTVIAACREVNIHNTITRFPGTYNALLSHRGDGFGREERRRFALARGILQKLQILVVDGAITTIEGETEAGLRNVLAAIYNRRTVLLLREPEPDPEVVQTLEVSVP